MRISDWSSDVCSSDLRPAHRAAVPGEVRLMASTTVSETHDWLSEDARKRVQRRHAADRRMRLYGPAAIGLAIGLPAILIGSLVLSRSTAFVKTTESDARSLGQEGVQ